MLWTHKIDGLTESDFFFAAKSELEVYRSKITKKMTPIFTLYFLFYVIITFEIIKQVWRINEVSKDLIMGVISGYISLGLVGFFIFMAIEISHPGSFDSALLTDTLTINEKAESLLYFSYITLMTIGYGEVIPVATAAQKASILLGLLGQFYLVIITAVTVSKYINYTHKQ